MNNFDVQILENQSISKDFFLLKMKAVGMTFPLPGQFLTVRLKETLDPLLRRPFAFSGWDEKTQTAEMIYQIRGKMTQLLSKKKAGESIDLLAPLGRGFPLGGFEKEAEGALLVAGGVGFGPILYLHQTLKNRGVATRLVSGFRSEEWIPKAICEANGVEVCTDDGTFGFEGNVVRYLDQLDETKIKNHSVFCCGPLPMMKSVNRWAEEKGLSCYVSMEEMMGCGVGACMGCVVSTKDERGSARVCVEGPVFDGNLIEWD